MKVLNRLISFGFGFTLSIGTAFAGGNNTGLFPFNFNANGFCGIWDIAPISVGGTPVDMSKCPKLTIGSIKSNFGDCQTNIRQGTYRLTIAAMHNKVLLDVDDTGNVTVLPPYADKELIADGGLGTVELKLTDVEFTRNGYAGSIFFEYIATDQGRPQCTGKSATLPVGAQWYLGFGAFLHSWVTFDQAGQIHVDARHGVYVDRRAKKGKSRLILDPVAVEVTPIGPSANTPWRIGYLGDKAYTGTRAIFLIPGTSYAFGTETVTTRFKFRNPCTIEPNFISDGDDPKAGFIIKPLCGFDPHGDVDFRGNTAEIPTRADIEQTSF